jgi:hypothetical protein
MTSLVHGGTPITNEQRPARAENHWALTLESAQLFGVNNPRNYHLAPQILSLAYLPSIRWLLGHLEVRPEIHLSAIAEPVLHGVENHYFGGALGSRWTFRPANWRGEFYLDGGLGAGAIDSTDDPFGEGQDFTFTVLLGAGFRFSFDERLSVALGFLYQHLSNAGLSEPERRNTGIDAFGPSLGVRWTF